MNTWGAHVLRKPKLLFLAAALLLIVGGAKAMPPIPAGFDIYKEPVTTAQHLDWLWSDYLGNGKIQAIAKITSALSLNAYSGSVGRAEKLQKSRPLTDQEKQAAVLDAVFQAAMWSLESNAKQHPAVLAELIRIESTTQNKIKTQNKINISHAYLLIILSKVDTSQYQMLEQNRGFTFTTPTGTLRFERPESNKATKQAAKAVEDSNQSVPPQLWSDHRQLTSSVKECAEKGLQALQTLGYSNIANNGNFSYGTFNSNRAAVKCVANGTGSFVYLMVAGSDRNSVEKLRNELLWKVQ
jgi:hypothetical protein